MGLLLVNRRNPASLALLKPWQGFSASVPRAEQAQTLSTANPLTDGPIGPGGGEVDEEAEDQARSEQQLFALCPSAVDTTTPLDSFRLIVSQVVQKEGGREGENK